MATLTERLRGAISRMDQGRFRAYASRAKAIAGFGTERTFEDLIAMSEKKNALVLLKQQTGWALVLKRVADRKQEAFAAWMHGAKADEADLKARVAELDALLQWVEGEIAAGEAADKALQEREK